MTKQLDNKGNESKFYTALSLKSVPTQQTYKIIVNKFLAFSGNDLSRDSIISFLGSLSKNSVLTAYYSLRFYYKSIEIPFEVSRKDIAPSSVERVKAIMTKDEVIKLIEYGKRRFGTIELGYLMLATVYGLRRSEIYEVSHKDINIEEGIFTVRAKKKEEADERKHMIPKEIMWIMEEMRSVLARVKSKPRVNKLNDIFERMLYSAGIELRPRLGWHSLRRRLITELMLSDAKPLLIRDFIRWKSKERDILFEYTILDWQMVDSEIFKAHPFLTYWGDTDD